MPTQTQYEFIIKNIDKVIEPVGIIGSRLYDYDNYDLIELLNKNGIFNISGLDLTKGKGVDIIVDITDLK